MEKKCNECGNKKVKIYQIVPRYEGDYYCSLKCFKKPREITHRLFTAYWIKNHKEII
jgi:hypothetical protein